MDTEQLRTFLEVSQTRHFGRAASNLFISQSAVSNRIKALEDIVGSPLFIRHRHDIQLTPAGNRLIKHAENILAAWNRAQHEVSVENESAGSMAVAATSNLWDIVLEKWLTTLQRQQPAMAIHGEVLEISSMTRRLLEGTLELGIAFEPPQLPQIVATPITDIPLIMVSDQAHASLQDALEHRYIYVNWGTSFAITHAKHFPTLQTPAIRLPLARIALHYLLSCGGSAYLPKSTVTSYLDQNKLFTVPDAPTINRTAYAIHAAHTELSSPQKAAIALLQHS